MPKVQVGPFPIEAEATGNVRSAQSSFSDTLSQHCHFSETKLLLPWRFVSMGVRQVLIVRSLLFPGPSGGKVEAGCRLKLETNLFYFQPAHLFFHNPCSPNAGQTLKCLTFLLGCCVFLFTLFMVPSCRVLIDNVQAALDAQFDSKARTASHSYEKYNTWDTVKSRTYHVFSLVP